MSRDDSEPARRWSWSSRPVPARSDVREIRHFPVLDSTNRYLLDEARAGAEGGLVAVADHQLAGRGRLGRRWEAPPGANLLVSVLLRPMVAASESYLASVALALATAEACREQAGLEVSVKWPNDLVVGGRKLAGVLGETLFEAGGSEIDVRPVVVGVGLNVEWPEPEGTGGPTQAHERDRSRAEPAHDLAAIATSLWRETGVRVERGDLLDSLLVSLAPRVRALETASGRSELGAELRGRCSTLGRTVRVSLPDGHEIVGDAADIDVGGRLIVETRVCIVTVSAGDVVHLRDL